MEEHRVASRADVFWVLHARREGQPVFVVAGAEVDDVSNHGLFVRASVAKELPKQGDRLHLQLFPKGQFRHIDTDAVVRWVGMSERHKCEGFGVEFSAPVDLDAFLRDG